MCGCNGGASMQTMTTTEVNEMLRLAQEQARNETEAMVASAAQAVQNANSGSSAQR